MLKYNTRSDKLVIDSNQINYKQCMKLGNYLGISAFVVMMFCISISFIFDQHFSLASQITAHIGTIIFAALVKIGYVIRCVGAHGLGHRAF